MPGETLTRQGVNIPGIMRQTGRIEAAPNRERQLSPGPNPQIGSGDWRAAMQSTETWKAVPGYECRYEVSNQGCVRRHPSSSGRGAVPGRVLKQNTNGHGAQHKWVTLYRGCIGTKFYVHRLVAAAFLVPATGPVVRHLDDNPANNCSSNLAWGTQRDNVQDMIRAGRARNGRREINECPSGHKYDAANTYISKKGSRSCRACQRARMYTKYHQINQRRKAA